MIQRKTTERSGASPRRFDRRPPTTGGQNLRHSAAPRAQMAGSPRPQMAGPRRNSGRFYQRAVVGGARAPGGPGPAAPGNSPRPQGQRPHTTPRPMGQRPRAAAGGGISRPPLNRRAATVQQFRPVRQRLDPVEQGVLRVIPVGGCEEVGRNMTIFEYENDIVILDMGLQFPEEDMPGIDYIIPNTKYLEGKEKNIRGVVFSHGHLDHIGAAPILLEKLGNPPIIAMPLTLALIKHKQEDYKPGTASRLKIMMPKLNDSIQLGAFTVKFFQVEHSIMDSVGTILETPVATILHPGDWTMERDKDGGTHVRYDELANLNRPTVLMLESLGATNEKRHGTYEEMYANLQNILEKASGRVVIATFSSQVERVKWIIQAAANLGKKVAIDGYSMKVNIELAQELGYMKVPRGVMIDIKDIDSYDENKVVLVCTGAQGEERAVLNRIALGEHRHVRFRRTDTVVFSSSIIPGNERAIQRLKDNIYRQCDHVVHGDLMDVHVSGHATRRDIVDMLSQVRPNYFIPVYGNHYFLKEARNLALDNGFPDANVFVPDNGSIIEFSKEGARMGDKKIPTDYVFVDGLGISDSQHIVLRDRQVLAEDGMVVVIATIQSKTGDLIQNPDIISRGFVFLKDNRELIEGIRHKVKKLVIESNPLTWADTNEIRNAIRDKIGQFIFTKTQKRPMILPVVIEV